MVQRSFVDRGGEVTALSILREKPCHRITKLNAQRYEIEGSGYYLRKKMQAVNQFQFFSKAGSGFLFNPLCQTESCWTF
jgi:hypothetical protein